MKKDDPDLLGFVIKVIIIVLVTLWWLWVVNAIKTPIERRPEAYRVSLAMITQDTLIGIVNPVYAKTVNYLKERAYKLNGQYGGQCVYFIQQFLSIFKNCDINDCEKHYFRGYAGNIEPNSEKPEIGNAVLFNGHTAVIIDIYNNELELIESNYNLDEKITVGRKVNKGDKSIRGYFEF